MFVNTYSYEPISKTDISNIVIMMHHCEGLTKKKHTLRKAAAVQDPADFPLETLSRSAEAEAGIIQHF